MSKEKYIDESWKEQASCEKDKLADVATQQEEMSEAPEDQTSAQSTVPTSDTEHPHDAEINFLNYVTSLGFQAMIFMGEIPNPATNQVEKNVSQAKFLIDTLSMLKEKTAGNLTDQENNLLDNSIYELQMKYVQLIQQEAPSEGGQSE